MIQRIYKKETDSQTSRTSLWLLSGRVGGGIVIEFEMNIYVLLYLKWMTNKDLLYSKGNSAPCYVAAGWEGSLGGEWIHVCIQLSPFAVHQQLSQHC